MKPRRLVSAVALLTLFSTVQASDLQSDEVRWSTAVQTFTGVVADIADREALNSVSLPHAWIAPFDLNRTESLSVLPDRLPTTNVVSARAYLHPAPTCATDIVADLQADGTIEPAILRKLVPADPSELRKADATVARWYASSLDAKPGDPVAMLVLYDDGKAHAGYETEPKLTFVLVRGEFDANRMPRISRVLYGPLQSAVK